MKNKIKKIPLLGPFLLFVKKTVDHAFYFFSSLIFSIKAVLKMGSSLNQNQREKLIIVSLTSIPQRLKSIHLTIESILSQEFKPDKVILWLSEDDNNGNKVINEDNLPHSLKRLVDVGLEIRFCDNVRSFRKLIYTLKEYSDDIIVTADDDVIYPRFWLKHLYSAYLTYPKVVHYYRGRKILMREDGTFEPYKKWPYMSDEGVTMMAMPTGKDGILYPPGSLHEEVFDENKFMQLCPTADDIWFKAMAIKNGYPCKLVSSQIKDFKLIAGSQSTNLYKDNVSKNDTQMENVFDHYGLKKMLNVQVTNG